MKHTELSPDGLLASFYDDDGDQVNVLLYKNGRAYIVTGAVDDPGGRGPLLDPDQISSLVQFLSSHLKRIGR